MSEAPGATIAGKPLVAELEKEEITSGGWFTKIVTRYVRHYYATREKPLVVEGTQHAAAVAAIRSACVKSALSGAASASAVTGATVLVGSTEGIAAVVAVPVAALGIGGEMIVRTIIHVELTCRLADIFGITFDPDDPQDLWRLYALAFRAEDHEAGSDDPGRKLVERVVEIDEEVGKEIGTDVLGESVLRNVVPFVGIAASSITNWRKTKALGDTLRRTMRYQRALSDALDMAERACAAHLDLLVEGLWFIFTADGRLAPEEAAILAWMLKRFDEKKQDEISAHFTEDELDWTERIHAIPVPLREDFYRALEIAAAVDKEVTLPERKLLRRIAKELGVAFDMERIQRMIRDFGEFGILKDAAPT